MATGKELRQWVAMIRHWMTRIDDAKAVDHAARLAAELELLAACKETADRQLV
jgi:hypothetical protein